MLLSCRNIFFNIFHSSLLCARYANNFFSLAIHHALALYPLILEDFCFALTHSDMFHDMHNLAGPQSICVIASSVSRINIINETADTPPIYLATM